MIEAVKQYEEKLNDKQFLIIYRERKDIKTVNVGFRDMNFLHMTGVKTRLSAQQFYAACLELQIPLHRITDSASNGSVFPVVTEHFSASSDHVFL